MLIRLVSIFLMIGNLFVVNLASGMNAKLDLSTYCTRVQIGEQVQLALYTKTMFRVRISRLQGEKFPLKYEIPFVIGKRSPWKPVPFTQREDGNWQIVVTDHLQIRINPFTTTWEVWSKDGSAKIYPSDGPIYGMFRDEYTVFDNASAFFEKNNNSRYSHWFFNPETENYTDIFLKEDLIQDFYFIYGPDYPALFRQFNELVGPEPLLPKKAYGFFQTQHLACEGNQEKLHALAREFRNRDIPIDNLIIDFEWGDGCDGEKEVKWGSRLDWSSSYSSPLSPKEMLDSLHALHYNVMIIQHSAPRFKNRFWQGWTETVYDEEVWWSKLKEKLIIGVDGFWQDTRRNDITDAVIWEGIQKLIGPEQRVLFLGCRKMQSLNPWDNYFCALPMNQIIGARRYPFNWTGDCSYSWNELKWQIKAITNTHGSMKGVTYITSDAVGADWRIQARWNQFADFSSISRSHNPKPWSGNIDVKGFVNKIRITRRDSLNRHYEINENQNRDCNTAENSIRKHRKLRYQLLPYIYTYAHINYLTGMPICRPMLLAFPNDHQCNGDQWPYQYLFGEELLVAPVYGDFQTMEIYLPTGNTWIDYWNHDQYRGSGILTYDVRDIDKLPLFVRLGAIITMQEEVNWIDPEKHYDPLMLDVFPGPESSFTLIEDDGVSLAYQYGRVMKTRFTCRKEKNSILFQIGKAEGSFDDSPEERTFLLQFNLMPSRPISVLLNSINLPEARQNQPTETPAWQYKQNREQVVIRFRTRLDRESNLEIRMNLE